MERVGESVHRNNHVDSLQVVILINIKHFFLFVPCFARDTVFFVRLSTIIRARTVFNLLFVSATCIHRANFLFFPFLFAEYVLTVDRILDVQSHTYIDLYI